MRSPLWVYADYLYDQVDKNLCEEFTSCPRAKICSKATSGKPNSNGKELEKKRAMLSSHLFRTNNVKAVYL